MSSNRAVRPHLHHLMLQLARRRCEAVERLPTLRLGPECAVSGPAVQTAKQSPVDSPNTKGRSKPKSNRSERIGLFETPPMGWMPKEKILSVVQALHQEGLQKQAGLSHANI